MKKEDLSREEIEILRYMLTHNQITDRQAYDIFSLNNHYSFDRLLEARLILSYCPDKISETWYFLTPAGTSMASDLTIEKRETDAAVQLARADALFAKVISVIALAVSIIALFK